MRKPSLGERVSRIIFALLFAGLGVWVISMAIKGETPAQPLDKPGDALIMGIFGSMFCMIGVASTAYALLEGTKHGVTIVASLMTAGLVLCGLCFLSTAIMQPGEIVSTSSVNGVEVSRSKGGIGGIIAFSIVGALPIIFVRPLFRASKRSLTKGR